MNRMKRWIRAFGLTTAVGAGAWGAGLAGPWVEAVVPFGGAATVRADDELAQRTTWAPPTAEEVQAKLNAWLASRAADEAMKAKVAALWSEESRSLTGPDLLDRFVETVATVEPTAREIVDFCRSDDSRRPAPKHPLLVDPATPPMLRDNLRLYVARWMVQHDLHDEALEQLDGVEPQAVVDPASLLFYRSVAYHKLLDKDKCLPTLARLMENEKAIPRRYVTLARLMDADLRPLKPDSLDEVSRLMENIRRRLTLGRAGTKVRKEEDDVIAKLDKMIEELEEQQKKQQQAAGGGAGGSSPAAPRPDSTPGGMQGPGNVDPKSIGGKSGWGNLPPKERQEVLQQISKDLPAHFRETIEEFFRKIARDGDGK